MQKGYGGTIRRKMWKLAAAENRATASGRQAKLLFDRRENLLLIFYDSVQGGLIFQNGGLILFDGVLVGLDVVLVGENFLLVPQNLLLISDNVAL
jgi:hypothetical protein